MTTTADRIAQTLADNGVQRVYGLPGEQTDALLIALEQAEIPLITVRHEQAAAMMAVGEARMTGEPAVCMATVGPGALNLTTGLATATLDGAPVLTITAQTRTDTQHRVYHQRINTLAAIDPVTVWSAALRVPSTASEVVQLALAEATRRRGAAHIEIAPDVAGADAPERNTQRHPVPRPEPSPDVIEHALNQLEGAERPVVLCGSGVLQGNATQAVQRFAEGLGAALITTLMGKGAVSYGHSHAVGVKGFGFRDFPDLAFEQADALIVVGVDPVELDVNTLVGEHCKVIVHLGHEPAPVLQGYEVTAQIVADVHASLTALARDEAQPLWCDAIQAAWRHDLDERGTDSLCHPGIVKAVRTAVHPHGVVVSDVGSHKQWIARTFDTPEEGRCLISNGLASMGVGLPMGIGAALAAPERPVVVVSGDGGFWMNGAEMETAVRHGVNLVVIVLTDDHFGLIRLKQQNDNVPVTGTTFGSVNIPAAAIAFGAFGHHVDSASELIEAIGTAIETGGVHVLSVPVKSSLDIEHIEDIAQRVDALSPASAHQ